MIWPAATSMSFDAQARALHQAQARAIKEAGHQVRRAAELGQERPDLGAGEAGVVWPQSSSTGGADTPRLQGF
jgi:hypothetical protein